MGTDHDDERGYTRAYSQRAPRRQSAQLMAFGVARLPVEEVEWKLPSSKRSKRVRATAVAQLTDDDDEELRICSSSLSAIRHVFRHLPSLQSSLTVFTKRHAGARQACRQRQRQNSNASHRKDRIIENTVAPRSRSLFLFCLFTPH